MTPAARIALADALEQLARLLREEPEPVTPIPVVPAVEPTWRSGLLWSLPDTARLIGTIASMGTPSCRANIPEPA